MNIKKNEKVIVLKPEVKNYTFSEIDANELSIAKVGKFKKLLYKKEPLSILTDVMYMPFGVSAYPNNFSGVNYTIDCSLDNNKSIKSQEIDKCIEKINTRIKVLLKESIHLFDANEHDSIDLMPILRENGSYPKLLKVTLPKNTFGLFDFAIYDNDKNLIQVNEKDIKNVLSKGKKIKILMECTKINYFKERFSLTWNAKQVKFVELNDIDSESEDSKNEGNKSKNDIFGGKCLFVD